METKGVDDSNNITEAWVVRSSDRFGEVCGDEATLRRLL